MIKHIVEYQDFDGNNLSQVIYFHFSIKAFRKYKELTGNEFYTDYSSVVRTYVDKLQNLRNDTDRTNLHIDFLIDPDVSYFLMNFVTSFYAHYKDGQWIQNEKTSDEIGNSIWLYELLNVDLFLKIFQHLTEKNIKKANNVGK